MSRCEKCGSRECVCVDNEEVRATLDRVAVWEDCDCGAVYGGEDTTCPLCALAKRVEVAEESLSQCNDRWDDELSVVLGIVKELRGRLDAVEKRSVPLPTADNVYAAGAKALEDTTNALIKERDAARAEVEKLKADYRLVTQRIDEFEDGRVKAIRQEMTAQRERDAAIKRAEEAERERDASNLAREADRAAFAAELARYKAREKIGVHWEVLNKDGEMEVYEETRDGALEYLERDKGERLVRVTRYRRVKP